MSTDRELTGDVGRLAELMSDISEDCWCAGWMSCNEFSLWRMTIDPTTERRYGFGHVTDDQVAELKALSERTGGWVIWWDDFSEPAAPIETWGERFIPMAEWQTLWVEWEGRAVASMAPQEKAE
jgi:hypothetical protein